MNLQCVMDRYGLELDKIAKRRGIGAREDCAVALVLEAIIAELGDAGMARAPIVPANVGHVVDAARFAEGRQRIRDLDDAAILRLLGRR